MGYFRLDNLDGKEPLSNVVETTSVGVVAGASFSALNLAMYFPKTFREAAGRTVNHTATLAMLGAVFGTGTTVSASLRGKDDPLNYFIGGCMSGAVLGAKNYSIGVGSCVTFGTTAAFAKLWHRQGWGPVIPPPTV